MKTIKVEIAKRKEDSIGYIADALDKIHATNDHGYTQEEVDRLLKIEKDLSDSFRPIHEQFKKISSDLENGIKAFVETIREIAEPIFNAICKVSEYGWYISPSVIREYPMVELANLLAQNNITEFENSIMKNSDNLIKQTINKAIKEFPRRKKVLREVLTCYKRKLYSASINLAYSQADGICNEIWDFGFFDKNGKPDYELKTYIEFNKFNDGVSSFFSKQLLIKDNEITMHSESFKNQFPEKVDTSFNRHLIIHGHSFDYGSKRNAVRAILILDFLLYFKEEKKAYNKK